MVLLLLRRLRVTPALRGAWLPLAALVLVQLWVALQLALGISVTPDATRQALLLGCGLVAAFVLVLLLVDSRERVRIHHAGDDLVRCIPGILRRRHDDE